MRAHRPRAGRPPGVTWQTVRFILERRTKGDTWDRIAERLNERGVPTSQGAHIWTRGTVRGITRSRFGREVAAELAAGREPA